MMKEPCVEGGHSQHEELDTHEEAAIELRGIAEEQQDAAHHHDDRARDGPWKDARGKLRDPDMAHPCAQQTQIE